MALARIFSSQLSLVSRGLIWKCIDNPCVLSVAGKQTVAQELGLPDPPKRPMTPYIRFVNANRQEIKKKYPELSAPQLTIKLASLWNELGLPEKSKWSLLYTKDREAYDLKYKEYMKKLTPQQIESMKDLKRKRSQDKLKRQIRRDKKKETEELGKPKHPGNAFTLYLLSLDRGEAPLKEFLTGAASRWRRLPEEEQEVFRERAKKQREQYEQELRHWEAKMIKSGRADLVRRHQQLEDLKHTATHRRHIQE
ncbi:transcription factor A, mitochondrial-like isoform X2 [Penaeus japonicus]|uniref:transcription factor A, mitochondrial-like isoform X2 n=1 Tax=Penaeus japonicus TaxID=27405 RepID=UPI001C70E1E3|nr:transcription factor A, mitochondrial-like isoform X2 [Penaeus japonicus]